MFLRRESWIMLKLFFPGCARNFYCYPLVWRRPVEFRKSSSVSAAMWSGCQSFQFQRNRTWHLSQFCWSRSCRRDETNQTAPRCTEYPWSSGQDNADVTRTMSGALLEAVKNPATHGAPAHWLWPRWDPPWAKPSTRKFARRRKEFPGCQGYCQLEVCGWCYVTPLKSNGLWLLPSWWWFQHWTSADPVQLVPLKLRWTWFSIVSSSNALGFASWYSITSKLQKLLNQLSFQAVLKMVAIDSPEFLGCLSFTFLNIYIHLSCLYQHTNHHQSECFQLCKGVPVWVVFPPFLFQNVSNCIQTMSILASIGAHSSQPWITHAPL